jgi:hypothetical protein
MTPRPSPVLGGINKSAPDDEDATKGDNLHSVRAGVIEPTPAVRGYSRSPGRWIENLPGAAYLDQSRMPAVTASAATGSISCRAL